MYGFRRAATPRAGDRRQGVVNHCETINDMSVVRPATLEDLETVVTRRVEFLGALREPGFRPSDDFV